MCYAAMASDDIRAESSSGGVFTILARRILACGGAVCGAAFDERFVCRYEIVRDEASLARLRGSKYVKAALTAGFLSALRAVLESGTLVLFVGTPCQVAAVKRIFAKHADSLITVDLICAGCPDQNLFNRYLDDNWGRESVAKYEFRSKVRGWRHHHYLLHVVLKDGREVWREKGEDEYMATMSSGLGLQEGCLKCPFCTMDRPGDLTIGDFWQVPSEMDDGKGTSAVVVNTEKGRLLFESVCAVFIKTAEYPAEFLERCQIRLRTPPTPAPGRKVFRESLAAGLSVKESVARALSEIDRNVAILSPRWETPDVGVVLRAYALNRALREMGFEARNIDIRPEPPPEFAQPANRKIGAFLRKHIPLTQPVATDAALRRLNSCYASFVGCGNADSLSFAEPGKRIVLVPNRVDPVFLLERSDWQVLADSAPAVRAAGGVAWYAESAYGEEGICEFLRGNSASLEDSPVHLDTSLGVEEWLATLSSASVVLTDSITGACFAVIFGRPFAVLVQQGRESRRMRNFLSALGLSERIFESPAQMPTVGELEKPVDFSTAEEMTVAMRGELADYLRGSLGRPCETV